MNHKSDKTTVLIVVILGCFMSPFMISSINIALPQIGNEFSMGAVSLGWVVTSYTLASVTFVVPFGRIADIKGRKKIFAWGMIVFTITSILMTVVNSGIMLIVFRFLQGVGGAMAISASVAILTSVFPAGERGKALGLYTASVYLGLSLGPFLGGLLTQNFGWRSIFIVCIPIGLAVIALIFWKLKEDWAEAQGEKFDIVGSAIYIVALIIMVYGFTVLTTTLGVILTSVGIVGLILFIFWETRVASPVLDLSLFRRNKAFSFSCLAALINYGATWGVVFLISLYLQYTKGLSPQDAGFILVSQPLVQFIFSPIAGRISDRVQPRIVASAGMAFTTIGLLLFIFLDKDTSMLFIIVSLVLIGFGLALFSSPNTNAAMSSVSNKVYGIASASISTARLLGMIVSMVIVMLLLAFYLGSAQITPEYYGAFSQVIQVAFIVFAVLCFGGIFASLVRGNLQEPKRDLS